MKIRLVYDNSKESLIEIRDEEAHNFFDSLNSGSIFWNEGNVGFWTDVSKIQHIIIDDLKVSTDEKDEKFLPDLRG